MNTYITLGCLLAFAAVCHGSGLGYGLAAPLITAPILAPAAVSHANLVKAAPIPVIRTAAVAPIITAPVVRTVSVAAPISYGYGLGSYGLGAYGLGGYGLGYGGLGYGYGLGGYGLGRGWGWGWGKH